MSHLTHFLVYSEQDPFTRSQRLEKSHALFRSSLEAYPTALGHFYLALSLARAGALQDLQQAIVYAAQAVETDSINVRYWHLLGILLTATEQWKAAAEILEQGAALDDIEASESVDNLPESNQNRPPAWERNYRATNLDETDSLAASTARPDDPTATPTQLHRDEAYILDRGSQRMPSSSNLLGSIVDQVWPLSYEIIENSLQLRLTQVYLAEAVDGAETADQKWIEVFRWISAKKAAVGDCEYPDRCWTPIYYSPLQPRLH
jgi:tetratricopeptide (TPR) repeat protein